MTEPIILIRNISKIFDDFHALEDVSLSVDKGDVVVIIGPSGAGKSTLLRCINRLEEFDQGEIIVDGIPLDTAENINAIRTEVGMVFQQFNLFPHMTVLENLMLAQRIVRGRTKAEAEAKARILLEKVGIAFKADQYPRELSGGQQQRVAIARALANRPRLLLADEPTGQLDSDTGHRIMMLIRAIVRADGVTAVVATHDPAMLDVADRVVELRDGSLV